MAIIESTEAKISIRTAGHSIEENVVYRAAGLDPDLPREPDRLPEDAPEPRHRRNPGGRVRRQPNDNDIRIENSRLGAGMRITADRPLSSESPWSIRTVLAMEPSVSMSIEPGNEFSWKSTYTDYTLPAGTK